jgi:hypothetical protein
MRFDLFVSRFLWVWTDQHDTHMTPFAGRIYKSNRTILCCRPIWPRCSVLFARESEMTKPVLKWLRSQGLLTKVEFGLPWGICDLVGLSFNQAQVMKRLSFRQHRPIGPMKRVELLRHIPDQDSGQSISLKQLKKATGESVLVPTLDRDLAKLISITPSPMCLDQSSK